MNPNNPKIYYAIYDGMEQKLITFVERERTKKPLLSGGGNLGFMKLVSIKDYEQLKKENEKLFSVYEECRSDNTAHFRKILELQKENDQLKSKLKVSVSLIKCNETFHRLGGIDDCEPCLFLKEIES